MAILRTLAGLDWFEWQINTEKAQASINWMARDNKFPENAGRDIFWQFYDENFVKDPYAELKKMFWSKVLMWEKEENSGYWRALKGDNVLNKLWSEIPPNFDGIFKHLWNIKPNCKKRADKDRGCRDWYLTGLKNFQEIFIKRYTQLETLNNYLKTKYSIAYEDIKDDKLLEKIIREFLYRGKLPDLSQYLQHPTSPQAPIQQPPVQFLPPEKPKPPEQQAPTLPPPPEVPEPKLAGFNPIILIALGVGAFMLLKNKKQ